MKIFLIFILTALSINTLANKADNNVKYRQSAFMLFEANFNSMKEMIDNKAPYNAKKFNEYAKNLKALSNVPWRFFETKNGKNSQAKDSIWRNSSKFKKMIRSFKKWVKKLDKTAKPRIGTSIVKLPLLEVENSCKSCHIKFKNK